MTIEPGRYGIWRRADGLGPELAAEVERLGFGAIWVGGSPPADLAVAESMLAATDRLAVATGIVNMWKTPAARLDEHLDAGANHVCAQVLTPPGADVVADLRRLAGALGTA